MVAGRIETDSPDVTAAAILWDWRAGSLQAFLSLCAIPTFERKRFPLMQPPNTIQDSPCLLVPEMLKTLSPAQSIFVARYLVNGRNSVEAAKIAFPNCKSPQIRGLQTLGCKSVRRILAMHDGENKASLKLEFLLGDTRRIVKRALKGANNERLVAVLTRISKTLAVIANAKPTD